MKRLIDRAGWALAGALGLMLVLVAARAIQAGPLDPPGPLASTMKTLGDLPPSWHQILVADDGPDTCHSTRFTCVMSDAAALDNETGLVWQIQPALSFVEWRSAVLFCESASTGGRRGWRLPSPDELNSLNVPGVGLPAGHPFGASAGPYWSSAVSPVDAGSIVTVSPLAVNGDVTTTFRHNDTTIRKWCVRGGAAANGAADSGFPKVWRTDVLPANDGAGITGSSSRFTVSTAGVADHETGLLWQRTPAATASDWVTAVETCARFSAGAEVNLGWRLPTLAEMLSLYTSAGSLPTGHPFTGGTYAVGEYWTNTTPAASTADAYTVVSGTVTTSTTLAKSALTAKHWCVRGGPGE